MPNAVWNILDVNDAASLPTYLLTLGEISLYNPSSISRRLVVLVQSLVFLPSDAGKIINSAQVTSPGARYVTAVQ